MVLLKDWNNHEMPGNTALVTQIKISNAVLPDIRKCDFFV